MKSSTIMPGLLLCLTSLFADNVIHVHVDGELVDSGNDGIFEALKKDSMEICVIASHKQRSSAVMEFRMPEKTVPAKKAVLRFFMNGKSGTTALPEKEDSYGPSCNLFGYLSPNADGELSLSDDGSGEKIAQVLDSKPADVKKPDMIDVTAFYNRAIKEKSAFIGFRIETAESADSQNGWRFRTSKFGKTYSARWTPALIVSE